MTRRGTTLRLATRSSALARRQAATVAEALTDRRFEVELVEVETTGDQLQDDLIHRLGTTGAFVRDLDRRVLDGDVDGAVHSLKDMPTEQPDALVVAAIPDRAPAHDVLVTPDGTELAELPEGATVGTASLRRTAQLLAERPDLDVKPIRGNVDTRIEKLLAPSLQGEHERRLDDETEDVEGWFDGLHEIERRAMERDVDVAYDAVVLAAAGLDRIGLAGAVNATSLPRPGFVPAAGQGAIALTMLDTDLAERVNETLDSPRTRVETTVERLVLKELGGGCIAPIGVHAVVQGEYVHVTAAVLSQDGEERVGGTRDLPVETYVTAAREFAADLADQGATDLVAAAMENQ